MCISLYNIFTFFAIMRDMAEQMNNQDKLDQIYKTLTALKHSHDSMLDDIDDMHDTLNWIMRRERIKMAMTLLYWLFMLGLVFGAYYYIQPILGSLFGNFDGLMNVLHNVEGQVGGLPDLNNLKKMMEALSTSTPR